MSIRLVLVRHGESEWHAENRYAGATDIALTPHGRAQGDKLAAWASHAGLAAVYSSPQLRSRESALPSAAQLAVPLREDPDLRELDFGVAEGLTRAEMRRRFPDDLAAFQRDPVAHHFPGGEHPRDAVQRYLTAFRELELTYPSARVLVVAHSTALRLTLCQLLGLPLGEYRRVFPFLVNCALTEIELTETSAALLSLNIPAESVMDTAAVDLNASGALP